MLQTMSLGPVILSTVIWLAMLMVLTCESLHNNGNHRSRHKYKRRHLFFGENNRDARLHQDNSSPLQQDPSLLMFDEDNEDVNGDASFELDKPREYSNKQFIPHHVNISG